MCVLLTITVTMLRLILIFFLGHRFAAFEVDSQYTTVKEDTVSKYRGCGHVLCNGEHRCTTYVNLPKVDLSTSRTEVESGKPFS